MGLFRRFKGYGQHSAGCTTGMCDSSGPWTWAERPQGRHAAIKISAGIAKPRPPIRKPSRGIGLSLEAAGAAAPPALIANLAVEIAPIRINLIAAGFVDSPLSASLLGDDLDARRAQLRATLPIGRVVGPADVAALAVHIMTNTALDGATYDIDGGEQFVPA